MKGSSGRAEEKLGMTNLTRTPAPSGLYLGGSGLVRGGGSATFGRCLQELDKGNQPDAQRQV